MQNIHQEIDFYLSDGYIPKSENPWEYWKMNKNLMPILANLAEKIFVIPASNAICERMFSLTGNILGKKKSNMNPSTLDSYIIYRKCKLNELKFEKDKKENEKKEKTEKIVVNEEKK